MGLVAKARPSRRPVPTSNHNVEGGVLTSAAVEAALRAQATAKKAEASARFFKTDKGGYAHGDQFIGVTVPEQRKIARRFALLALDEAIVLLNSPIHELRLTALLILVRAFERALPKQRKEIAALYLKHKGKVNNWDLVDSSAPQILGASLAESAAAQRDPTWLPPVLRRLAKSKNMWDRRIAILATFAFIRAGQSTQTLAIAEMLLHDREDLIHKAVGWLLREVGQRLDLAVLRAFLKKHHQVMPRTALRYAIEHLAPTERQRWLARK